MNVWFVGSVPVRFRTTPVVPAGATFTVISCCWPTLPKGPICSPGRVSSTRTGDWVVTRPPRAFVACEPYQPTTSMITWLLPARLKRSIRPPDPSLALTRLGTVWPGVKLRFDAVGRGAPVG